MSANLSTKFNFSIFSDKLRIKLDSNLESDFIFVYFTVVTHYFQQASAVQLSKVNGLSSRENARKKTW